MFPIFCRSAMQVDLHATTIDAPSKVKFKRAERSCHENYQVVMAFAGSVLRLLVP